MILNIYIYKNIFLRILHAKDLAPENWLYFGFMIDLADNQSINVEAVGVLNIHGVDRDVIVQTYLNIEDRRVQFSSSFNVLLEDFRIKVPKIVRMNIADTIMVNVSGSLIEKMKD